jgi:ABC-type nitrate/sulfonate/bicarbonate transport system substrate-binding protein
MATTRRIVGWTTVFAGVTMFLLGLVTLICIASPAHAADKLIVGKAANAWTFIPVNVGVEVGTFAAQGVEVEIVNLASDAKLQQALVAGSVDIGVIGGPTMAQSVRGSPVLAVAAFAREPRNMAIITVADSPIRQVADLKGKLLGVPGTASLTEWMARRVALVEGWGKDGVRTVSLGGFDANLAALKTKQTDAMVTATEIGYMLEARGEGRIVTVLGAYAPQFHAHVIVARNQVVAEHPDSVARFLKGYFDAIAFMKKNKAKTTEIAMGLLKLDEAVMNRAYDEEIGMLQDDGHFDRQAVDVLKQSFVDMGLLPDIPRDDQILTTRYEPMRP